MTLTKPYTTAIYKYLNAIFLIGVCVGFIVWSYGRQTPPTESPVLTGSADRRATKISPKPPDEQQRIEALYLYKYEPGSFERPRFIEREINKFMVNGIYLSNLFAVHLNRYSQKTYDEVIQRYTVDDDLTIHPWFDDLLSLENEKPGDDLQFTIPGTRQSIKVPSSYIVELTRDGLHLNSSPLTQLAYICTDRDSPYCIEMRKVWGTRVTALASQYTSVTTRTVDWSGEIYAWISDHVSWQGSTEREWVARGQQKRNHQTIIANRTYYKLGLGCCGDITYSYITKGTSPMGTPLLIIFTVEGNQRFIDNSAERIAPNLEKILGTLQTR
ncbi:MAG: hypothetical protein WCJ70_05100 [bacterium]